MLSAACLCLNQTSLIMLPPWCVSGELVNANSGLGFNGYDKSGAAKWDLIDNADILTIEVRLKQHVYNTN